jgi:hypothetical protein
MVFQLIFIKNVNNDAVIRFITNILSAVMFLIT